MRKIVLTDDQLEDIKYKYLVEFKTLRDIADEYNMCISTLSKILKCNGVEIRDAHKCHELQLDIDTVNEIYNLYFNENLSKIDICKKFNISCTAFDTLFKNNDGSLRPLSEVGRLRGLNLDQSKKDSHRSKLKNYGNIPKNKLFLKKMSHIAHTEKEFIDKRNNTLKRNGTFNSSKQEDNYYEYLCSKFGVDDVIRWYKDDRYPFHCDFYIKSLDLFIELNLHGTHGDHPFNCENLDDLKLLDELNDKAKYSDFYKNNIKVGTVTDPLKLRTAKNNGLHYIMIYDIIDLYREDLFDEYR